MYEIRESEMWAGDRRIPTFRRDIHAEETRLIVEAGTSASVHRNRQKEAPMAYFSLASLGDNFSFRCIPDGRGSTSGFEVFCDGEDGLRALIAALEFAERAINDLRFERRD